MFSLSLYKQASKPASQPSLRSKMQTRNHQGIEIQQQKQEIYEGFRTLAVRRLRAVKTWATFSSTPILFTFLPAIDSFSSQLLLQSL
jgi:hypothetical protein